MIQAEAQHLPECAVIVPRRDGPNAQLLDLLLPCVRGQEEGAVGATAQRIEGVAMLGHGRGQGRVGA